jgi:chemotaxis protein CheX
MSGLADGAPVISADIQNMLLEPFITATRTAVREMANAEVVVRELGHRSFDRPLGCVSALLRLEFAKEGYLLLLFPKATASEIARRMLAEVPADLDEQLIGDCIGEIGNVIAGQAKTLLAGTQQSFTFSLPRILVDSESDQLPTGPQFLEVLFGSELGEFCLRLGGNMGEVGRTD